MGRKAPSAELRSPQTPGFGLSTKQPHRNAERGGRTSQQRARAEHRDAGAFPATLPSSTAEGCQPHKSCSRARGLCRQLGAAPHPRDDVHEISTDPLPGFGVSAARHGVADRPQPASLSAAEELRERTAPRQRTSKAGFETTNEPQSGRKVQLRPARAAPCPPSTEPQNHGLRPRVWVWSPHPHPP